MREKAFSSLYGPFETLLISNRGEIACRIIRTAKRLGLRTVAVFSDADRNAKHVQLADDAYRLGPPPATESYLRIDNVIQAARDANAHAIHPGYGFLSENAAFAQRCAEEGLVFIGPPAEAIRQMASKEAARNLMQASGVPVIPGFSGSQDPAILAEEAARIGFPLLIKPVMGGGGIGMVVAHEPCEFESALRSSKKEARKAFGNDDVLLELWLPSSRHVEFQIVGDWKGNYVHLHERDCSVQRRHQKIIEEAPAPLLSCDMRARMGDAAIAAARAVDYRNCGTVEFLVDTTILNKPEKFYFLEMNTRLQVEHPVTEMITGVDLVEWQLRVAAGEELPITGQEQIKCNGHAMEARIYAESPSSGFLPHAGKIASLAFPADFLSKHRGSKVRVDAGIHSDIDSISMFYDPMFAKVIAWGESREDARKGLSYALANSSSFGVETNIDFAARITNADDFVSLQFDSGLLQKYPSLVNDVPVDKHLVAEAAVAAAAAVEHLIAETAPMPAMLQNAHPALTGFHMNGARTFSISMQSTAGNSTENPSVTVTTNRFDESKCTVDGKVNFGIDPQSIHLNVHVEKIGNLGGKYSTVVPMQLRWAKDGSQGVRESFFVEFQDSEVLVHREKCLKYSGDLKTRFCIPNYEAMYASSESRYAGDASTVTSPMPGRVARVFVSEGDVVEKGGVLLEVEAMKMTHTLRAPMASTVVKINAKESETVDDSTALVELQIEEAGS